MKSVISIVCLIFLASCDAGPSFLNFNLGTSSIDFGSDELNETYDGILLDQNLEVVLERSLNAATVDSSSAFIVPVPLSTELGAGDFDSNLCDVDEAEAAIVSYGDRLITVNPASDLDCNSRYAICISPSIKYVEGHQYQGAQFVFQTIVCEPDLANLSAQIVRTDDPITPISFTNSGGNVASCSVSPALPTGLEIAVEDGTCQVEGTTVLTSGSATYTITGTNAAGSESASVALSVIEAIALNPSGFSMTSQTTTSIGLGWTSGGGRTVGFHIKYATGSTPPADCSSPQVTVGNVTSTTVTGLTEGTEYSFRICAYNGNATPDDSSGVTLSSKFTLAENVVMAATTITDSSLTLNWGASAGAATYRVKRAAGAVAPANCSSPDYTTAATSQLDSGLSSATQYSYRVCAVNSNGDVSSGTTITEWTYASDVTFGSSVRTSTTITLIWSAVVGATSYRVKRASGATAPANCSSPDYTTSDTFQLDSGLTQGAQYSYRVCAVNGNNESSVGTAVTVWTYPDDPILSGSSVGVGTVNLSWLAATGASTYRVQALIGSSAPAQYCPSPDYSTASLSQAYAGLTSGSSYVFRICSVSANNDVSPGVTIVKWLPTSDLATLDGTAASTSSITLSWTDGSGTNAGYYISYAPGLVAPSDCDTPDETVASGLTSSTVNVGSTGAFSFRVCPFNGDSPPEVASGITVTRWTLTNNPSGLLATTAATTSVQLNWTAAPGSTNGYVISRAAGSTAPANCSTTVGSVGSGTTTFTDSPISTGQHSYRVCSVNGNPTPDASSGVTVSGWTLPSDLLTLTATAVTTARIDLSWTVDSASSNNGYRISRAAGSAAPADCSAPLFTLAAGTTSYSDTGITAGEYTYRVCAINGNVPIVPSAGLTANHWTLPENVDDLNTAGVGSTSVTLTWTPVDSADRYLIVYDTAPTVPADCTDSPQITAGPPETVGGLTATTTYNFLVCSQNDNSPRETSSGSSLQVTTLAMMMMMMGSSFGPPSMERGIDSASFSEAGDELRLDDASSDLRYVFKRNLESGDLHYWGLEEAPTKSDSTGELLAKDVYQNLSLSRLGSSLRLTDEESPDLVRTRRFNNLKLDSGLVDILPTGELFGFELLSKSLMKVNFPLSNKVERVLSPLHRPQKISVDPTHKRLLSLEGRGQVLNLYEPGAPNYFLRDQLQEGELRPNLVPNFSDASKMIMSPDGRHAYVVRSGSAEIVQVELVGDSNR